MNIQLIIPHGDSVTLIFEGDAKREKVSYDVAMKLDISQTQKEKIQAAKKALDEHQQAYRRMYGETVEESARKRRANKDRKRRKAKRLSGVLYRLQRQGKIKAYGKVHLNGWVIEAKVRENDGTVGTWKEPLLETKADSHFPNWRNFSTVPPVDSMNVVLLGGAKHGPHPHEVPA